MSCKELIQIFEKIGGKFECNYETRTCTLFPNNITCKMSKDNSTEIGYFVSQYAYSGHFDDFVKLLPDNKSPFIEVVHDYQIKNTGGFIIEFQIDKDGFQIPKK